LELARFDAGQEELKRISFDLAATAQECVELLQPLAAERNFTPGRYVLHCEMPLSADAKSGTQFATHADAGMVSAFDRGHDQSATEIFA
jgi:hypothetical protein